MKNPYVRRVLVISLILAVLCAVIFIFQTPKPAGSQYANRATSALEALSTTTTGWQTYTNSQYRFSLEHPASASVSLVDHVAPHGTDLVLPGSDFVEKDGAVGTILRFSIFQKPVDDLEKYVADEVKSGQELNAKYPDVNGNPAVEIVYTTMIINGNTAYLVSYYYPQNSGQEQTNRVYMQNAAHTFIFSYSSENFTAAKQMLSTFKFTK